MQTTQTLILACALAAGGVLSVGCASGRSPEVYRDDTEKLLQTTNDSVGSCYTGILKGGTPAAQGSVTVRFIIQEDTGSLVHAKVDKARSTAPEAVQACVSTALQGLRLAPADAQRGKAMFTWDFAPKPPEVVNQPTDKPAS